MSNTILRKLFKFKNKKPTYDNGGIVKEVNKVSYDYDKEKIIITFNDNTNIEIDNETKAGKHENKYKISNVEYNFNNGNINESLKSTKYLKDDEIKSHCEFLYKKKKQNFEKFPIHDNQKEHKSSKNNKGKNKRKRERKNNNYKNSKSKIERQSKRDRERNIYKKDFVI